MVPLLVLLALGGGWLWYRGWIGPQTLLRWGTGLAVAGAAVLALRGQWLPGAALAALVAAGWTRTRLERRAGFTMTEQEARAILGLPQEATAADVRAAHRRLIAQVHPDRGGTAELARRVNAARDRLLGRR
jgi:hypothetical protein